MDCKGMLTLTRFGVGFSNLGLMCGGLAFYLHSLTKVYGPQFRNEPTTIYALTRSPYAHPASHRTQGCRFYTP